MVPWLKLARTPRVVVLGDLILDEYVEGDVSRISPEAPVPVAHVKRTYQVPGGAANAARNIRLAGGDVIVGGVIGRDPSGEALLKSLHAEGIQTHLVHAATDRPTTRKTRVTSSNHQLLRIDYEVIAPIDLQIQEELLTQLEALEFDAILLSDYGKGALPVEFVAKVLALAARRGTPSIVDPKALDFTHYREAAIITPNYKEACAAAGVGMAEGLSGDELGRRLVARFGLRNVLVTMGSSGMVFVPGSEPLAKDAIAMPALAREVFDVSGAGDTVAGLLSLGLAAGSPFETVMRVANVGAAVVVGKWGTQPIHLHELEMALHTHLPGDPVGLSTIGKVVRLDELSRIFADPELSRRRVVYVHLELDSITPPHVHLLETARTHGDVLVVGAKSRQAAGLLASLRCVEHVVAVEGAASREVMALLPAHTVEFPRSARAEMPRTGGRAEATR
jgi:D-beta-D-heptose 7-phosphate kinase/D-beta-D-heptose 1-phosphate adenosyltransferase